jgi:hypothetical protein
MPSTLHNHNLDTVLTESAAPIALPSVASVQSDTLILPDFQVGYRFIEALTGSRSTQVTFQTFDDNKERRDQLKRTDQPDPLTKILHGHLDAFRSELSALHMQGAGIFITINETDLQGRKARNITGLRAVFVDDDEGRIEDPTKLALPPSIIVRSKRGYHIYWLLHPGEAIDRFPEVQKALSYNLDTDSQVSDVARTMRLPGTFHLKSLQDPFLVELVAVNSDRKYSLDEVLWFYPPAPKAAKVAAVTCAPVLKVSPSEAVRTFRNWAACKPIADGERHDHLKAIVAEGRARVDRGYFSDDDGLAVVVEYCERSGIKGGPMEGRNLWEHSRGKGFTPNLPASGASNQSQVEAAPSTIHAGKTTTHEAGWEEPVCLDQPTLPALPEVLGPAWFGDMVTQVAAATETPTELPLMVGLAVLATCCQKRFEVMPEPGYTEPLCIWTVVALEPGNRKSAVMTAMTAPLLAWEHSQAMMMKEVIQQKESERKTIEARVKGLRDKAARASGADFQTLKQEIADVETSLPETPTLPRLCTQDVTPERLGALMAENGERQAIISDEGGIFDIIAGRYSGGIPNLDVFLQGHSGTRICVDRGSRAAVWMNSPTLTMGLSPQPDVLRGLADHPGFRGRGLLARFLFAIPTSKVGYRELRSQPVSPMVEAAYAVCVKALLETPPAKNEQEADVPHILRFDDGARAAWKEFAHTVERGMRDGGRFEFIKDWAGKLAGQTARIAGLLHCATHAHDEPWNRPINKDTMTQALQVAAVLVEHAFVVFDLMGADPAVDAARHVLRWINRRQKAHFTARDCYEALKGRFRRRETLDPAFEVLAERHYIREHAPEGTKKRGRPSLVFQVNPVVVEGWK